MMHSGQGEESSMVFGLLRSPFRVGRSALNQKRLVVVESDALDDGHVIPKRHEWSSRGGRREVLIQKRGYGVGKRCSRGTAKLLRLHLYRPRARRQKPVSLVSAKEKELVLHDRSADGS